MKKTIALLLALLLALSVAGCAQENPAGSSGSTTPTVPKELAPVFKIKSYTGTPDAVIANSDTVVATFGSAELTNSLFQMYYWMDVYDFLNNYSDLVSSYGLDISKPLDEQACSGTDGTWQHHFILNCLEGWRYYQSLALAFDESKMTMPSHLQETLDGLEEELKKDTEEGKYESIDAMIQADAGPGCTVEDYYSYSTLYHKAYAYFNATLDKYEITDEMIDAYFTEHEANMAVNGITKTTGDSYKVRHILFQVAETKTDADWEACRQKAQKMLDDWLAGGGSEDSFAELAKEHSEDPGSKDNGGMYNGLTDQTSFVQEFKDFYLEESRQVGDYGLVKTSYGYHIMYFSGTEPIWYYYCREMLRDEEANRIVKEAVEKYEPVIYYDKILIGEVKLTTDTEDK